jgi:DNA-binding NarL/FixJ family response regulator
MNKQTIIALIMTRSIPLADGLEALLKALPQIDEVAIARNLEIAIQQIGARKPRIALLDLVILESKPETFLQKINALSPKTQRVLLVENVQAVNLMPNFAEAVLIKGISPPSIVTILTDLLLEKGE